jgi:putative ABC transport system ATP-binding protein
MIVMNGVTKIYEMGVTEVLALDNINLRIGDGDFLAIMGPSGCGKSTLLYTIGGLLTPSKGEVIVHDEAVYKMDSNQKAKFRRENVGFIFQTFELIPYLSALENVMLPLYLSGVSAKQHEELAEKALAEVGLEERAFHKPSELSGGEQQRVSIARGISNSPRILLADEPTGNLDQKTGKRIMSLLKRLNEEIKITLIMVTHDHETAKYSKELLTMVDGHFPNQ